MQTLHSGYVLKYLTISRKALQAAQAAPEEHTFSDARELFLDTIQRYLDDAEHFQKEEDYVHAFAAINYAHGWLDAGARLGLWIVRDSRLFAVDDA